MLLLLLMMMLIIMDDFYTAQIVFAKIATQCVSTHHSHRYVHEDIHIICGHSDGLSRFVERPV